VSIRVVAYVSALALCGLASTAAAEVSRFFYAGSSVFDLREKLEINREENYFLLETVPWLDALLESDALMRTSIFHVEASGTSFTEAVQYDLANNFTTEVGLESRYHVLGYITFVSKNEDDPRYFFLSTDDSIGHRVICGGPDESGAFISCEIRARYEADERVMLIARILRPIPELSGIAVPSWDETWSTFGPTADRMREIARCLDVTDRVQHDEAQLLRPSSDPIQLFSGCKEKLMN
jgi:hypothetical protein